MKPARALLLLALVVGAGLRLHALDRDPPATQLARRPGETPSGAYLSDEGWYTRPARPAPGLSPGRLVPLYSSAQRAAGVGPGSGLARARLTSALAGALLLVLAAGLVDDPRRRLALVALLALDFPLVAFSRLALADMTALALVVAAGLASRRDHPTWAGVLAMTAGAAKPTYLLAALLGAALGVTSAQRRRLLLGAGAAGAAAAVLWVLPHLGELGDLAARLAPKRGLRLADPLGYFHEAVWWFHWGPLLPLALAGLAWGPRDRSARVGLGMLLGGLAMVAPFTYQPLRYHLAVLPGAALLAAGLVVAEARGARHLARLALGALLAVHGSRLAHRTAATSLRDAARAAGVQARAATPGRSPIVLGHLADTFALESGWQTVIPSIEAEPADPGSRVRDRRPDFVLAQRAGEAERWISRYLPGCAPGAELGRWEVMGAYYTGEPVRLVRVTCPREAPAGALPRPRGTPSSPAPSQEPPPRRP